MRKTIKSLVIVCLSASQILFCSLPSRANNNELPQVGISVIIDNITEDQAKIAYAEYLENLLKQEEVRLMSSIIYCEAGNQCEAGKQAVGIVVMNRVASNDFKNDIQSVIYEPNQFSPVTDGSLAKALMMYDEEELPQECIDAALYCLDNNKTVIYNEMEIDMSSYLFFSRNLSNAFIRIEDHDFR